METSFIRWSDLRVMGNSRAKRLMSWNPVRGWKSMSARNLPGFCAVEIEQAGGTELGKPVGARQTGLAYRVLGDEHEVSWTALRHPWRRARFNLSPSRERDRPVGGGIQSTPRALLDP